jgi:hypothetical protein
MEKGEECWIGVFERLVCPPVREGRCRCCCRPALLRRVRMRAEEEGIPLGARNWGIEVKEAMASFEVCDYTAIELPIPSIEVLLWSFAV